MLDIVGLREAMGQFLAELQQVNKQLATTNRKLDQVVELLKIQADDCCPPGWLPVGTLTPRGDDEPE